MEAMTSEIPPGTILYPGRFKQQVSFAGMVWGSISPTDIELAIDFRDRLFVFVDFKEAGKEVGEGQRLLYERLATRLEQTGCRVLLVIARHHTPSSQLIPGKDAIVSEWRWKGSWRFQNRIIPLKEFIDLCLRNLGLDKLFVAKVTP